MPNDEHLYRSNDLELMDDNEHKPAPAQAEAVALPVGIPEIIVLF